MLSLVSIGPSSNFLINGRCSPNVVYLFRVVYVLLYESEIYLMHLYDSLQVPPL